ncbi:hypothetical protein P168DRAFT_323231 [Aspergillus campestris IBT 28561]|uniref:Uncharacterized protein n=1 Tax=Aspergillus campestris (strain IBT 28561) TaxID=1392248 RepID=A0A2I1DDS9_ASPC2|nr:uncharacterized protein P168DRAFT_323231 [Aspergillus campestris IBT 28561]PKY08042.1 hypothetical protein P168DRAFT_323231 [Aspergillus campestris IBT 28561]
MAPNLTSYPLTETNLAWHDQLLQCEHPTDSIVPWVEKVIKEEQIHQFYTSLNTATLATHQANDITDPGLDIVSDLHLHPAQGSPTGETHPERLMGDLKLFDQRPGICIESPLERFLTPDGCSAPSYFVRPALENVSERTGFGCLEGMEERRDMARGYAAAVSRRRRDDIGGWSSGRS